MDRVSLTHALYWASISAPTSMSRAASTAVRIRVQTVLCQYSIQHDVRLHGTVRSYEVEQHLYGFGPYICTYFNVQGCIHSSEEQSTNRQMKGRYLWSKWIGIHRASACCLSCMGMGPSTCTYGCIAHGLGALITLSWHSLFTWTPLVVCMGSSQTTSAPHNKHN